MPLGGANSIETHPHLISACACKLFILLAKEKKKNQTNVAKFLMKTWRFEAQLLAHPQSLRRQLEKCSQHEENKDIV